MNVKKIKNLSSMYAEQRTRNGKHNGGIITIIKSPKNGNRLHLSRIVVSELDLEDEVWIAKAENFIIMSKEKFSSKCSRFVIKSGATDKKIIYCKELVDELADFFDLDFENAVSQTLYDVEYDTDDDTGIELAIISNEYDADEDEEEYEEEYDEVEED